VGDTEGRRNPTLFKTQQQQAAAAAAAAAVVMVVWCGDGEVDEEAA
jgi:hypothetical protein